MPHIINDWLIPMPNNNASQPRWSPHTDMWFFSMTFWLDYLTYIFQNTLPIKKNCSTFTGYSISLPGKQIYAINISISWPLLDLILSPQRSQSGNGAGQLIGFGCGQHITSAYMEMTTPNTRYEWRDQKCSSVVAEVEIKWQLQVHFLEWKCCYFDLNVSCNLFRVFNQ